MKFKISNNLSISIKSMEWRCPNSVNDRGDFSAKLRLHRQNTGDFRRATAFFSWAFLMSFLFIFTCHFVGMEMGFHDISQTSGIFGKTPRWWRRNLVKATITAFAENIDHKSMMLSGHVGLHSIVCNHHIYVCVLLHNLIKFFSYVCVLI